MVREIHSLMGEFHHHSNPLFPNYAKLIHHHHHHHQDPIFTTQPHDQLLDIPFPSPSPSPSPSPTQTQQQSSESNNSSSSSSSHSHGHDDAEIFSDIALNYINSMLNEDDDNFHDYSPALEAAEKPFYDILGKKYPPSPVYPPPESIITTSSDTPDSISPNYGNSIPSTNSSGGGNWPYEYFESQMPIEFTTQSSFGSEFTNQSSFGSASNNSDSFDGFDPNQFLDMLPAWQFHRGVEEALKFLPSNDKLVIDLETTANQGFGIGYPPSVTNEVKVKVNVKSEEKEDSLYSGSGFGGLSRGKKNPYSGDYDSGFEEGKRSVKQSAIATEDTIRSTEFDEVLLCHGDVIPKVISDIREALQHVINSKNSSGNGHGKGRGKKQAKKEVIDLRTMLIHCAQMVAADDQRSTNELLKQIRQHSSMTGDGSQRLAHYFANGIEARLAGTGSEIYNSYQMKRRTAKDYLKAYQLYLAACPFKKISYFFSNQTILNVSEKASTVHVVDFGIGFGFQWPSLLQRMEARPGGPPKLRITGIDLPQPGFRPAERIEDTGRRLTEYANGFNVPFEYKAIAAKWEEVRIEDLNIQEGEVLVVNCLYQLKYLADETVVADSPRNMVLNNIRKMNPDVFIHGIVNGSYSAPFFVTRFREALFHFSALYDMLETIVPREDDQRMLIEREIFGREALNVIACEGLERMERPETYKQWQVRNLRAGFVQHPLCKDIVKKSCDKVKNFYHKDFCMDDDSRWLLQGWKGRIVCALSSWKPNNA